jgi:propanediol utilization protein
MKSIKVPIEISSRHIHLSKEDFIELFGEDEKLVPIKKLSQPEEFASDKFVTLINNQKKIENVRVVGPFRKNSQIEISLTDAYNLKLNPFPKIRLSGNIKGTIKMSVQGKKGIKKIPCIIAKRHLHISEEEAKKINLKNNQKVKIEITGERGVIFDEVITRILKDYKLAVHLDSDEGNSAGIFKKTFGRLIIKES